MDTKTYPTPPTNLRESKQECLDACCRENAKSALESVIRQKESEITNLRTLQGMLPTELSSAQDEALWSIVNKLR